MSEQGEVRIRNVSTQRSDNLVQSVVDFGGGLVRLGFSVVTLPLALLPEQVRDGLRNASREILLAAVRLPRDLTDAVSEAVEDWAREGSAPRDEMAAKN